MTIRWENNLKVVAGRRKTRSHYKTPKTSHLSYYQSYTIIADDKR